MFYLCLIKEIVEEWRKNFLQIVDGTDYLKGYPYEHKLFLTSTLNKRNEEWKKMIEELKVTFVAKGSRASIYDKAAGYNQALDDLLTKLNQE